MKKTICFIFLAEVLTVSSLPAATRTWLSNVGGLWTSNANWSDSTQPGANDIADLSAATGTIDLTADVTVGEILYNPTPVSGRTNTLTILSDTAAPSSRTITLTTTATRHVQVGEGAELQLDTDFKPTGMLRKDGYGTLVLKRRLPGTVRTDFQIEQGRVVNEGAISLYASRMFLGTVEPDAGDAPEFVMREGSSYVSTLSTQGSDLLWGGNRLLGSGAGSRAVVTHEGGTLDLSINASGGIFLNAYAAGGSCEYNLNGGEVNLSGKGVWVAFDGTGSINQAGGKLKAGYLNFSQASTGSGTYNLTGGELWLGGIAKNGSGTATFNIGGVCIYPLGSGFNVYGNTHPKFTGINGPTRFCATGSEFTSYLSGVSGPGGFIKEGPDTLVVSGNAHSFSGPVIISNGTLNVSQAMNGGNAVLVAGGSMNLGAGVTVTYSSLMVTGGVFQVAAGSKVNLPGTLPLLQVAGTGSVKLLDGASLPGVTGLSVMESGGIDLSAGGTASVYRLLLDGVEQVPGFYTSANCTAITGGGTLAVNSGGWTGAGGDMLWSTGTNWVQGATPAGYFSTTDLSGVVSNDAPLATVVFDPAAVTNNFLVLNAGVNGAVVSNACPAGVTNTIYMQSAGVIYVGAGETLVLDHDICLMGNLYKRGEGTLSLRRKTFALSSLVTASSTITLIVEGGTVISGGAITNVLVMVGKPERSEPNATPEFILEDTPEASIGGTSFVSALSYLTTSKNPGNGVFTQSGGTVTPEISWQTKSQIGFSTAVASWGATGTYNLVGGTLRVASQLVLAANAGVGVFNQSGGVADIDKLVLRTGRVSLIGGLFTLNEIDNTAAASCSFSMGGGRLEPKTTTPVTVGSAVKFTGENGDMTFAPETGRAVTLSGALSGEGGFIKVGDGTLTLSGAGSFAGPVVVSNGTLAVSGSMIGTNDVTLLDGTINVSGSSTIKWGVLGITNGTVNLASDVVVSAERFFIEGTEWGAGVYASTNCSALTGDGLLIVGAEPGAWINGGADDNWSTTGNWVAGLIPNSAWSADLSAAVSNAAPLRTLILDMGAITNKQVVLASGVDGAVLTNTCPAGVTNTLYLSAGGVIEVGEGETLVMDHDLCLMGGVHKRGLGTLILRRTTTLLNPGSVIYLYVDAGNVINEGPMRDVLISVGKLSNTDVGPTPEFILADTAEASVSGNSFITAINASAMAPGPGLFTQNGGTVTPGINWGNQLVLGHTAALTDIQGTGTYNLVNGTLTVANSLYFGRNSGSADGHYGIFKQSGGTADIGSFNGVWGEIHLNGGLFKVNSMNTAAGTGVLISLGGGRLEPKSGTWVNIESPTVFTGINGDMTFAPEAGRTVRLSGTSSGPGGFVKEGAGTLMLNSTHAFEGDAQINAGICMLTTEGSVTTCTNVLISADAALTLERSGAALNSNLWLRVASDGRVNLDFEGEVDVGHLVLNGSERPGRGKRYGSSSCSSELDYINDDLFSGTGVLKVVGPRGPDGTMIILR